MSDKITIQLDGDKEILRALMKLDDQASGDPLKNAGMAGAEVLREAASIEAGIVSSELGENIVAEIREATKDNISIDVGPDKERFWGLFFEFGTQGHEVAPDLKEALKLETGQIVAGAEPSGVHAEPWLRPAFDESQEEILAAVAAKLQEELGLE